MPQTPTYHQYASVIVQIDAPGLDQPFTYGVPESMTVDVGDAVLVPFGNAAAIGYVIANSNSHPASLLSRLKTITCRIENGATFNEEMVALAKWVAEDTFMDLRDVFRLIAPEIMTSQLKISLRLNPDWRRQLIGCRSAAQVRVAETLDRLGGSATPVALTRAMTSTVITGSDGATPSLWDASEEEQWPEYSDGRSPDSSPGIHPGGFGAGQDSPIAAAIAELVKNGVINREQSVAKPRATEKTVRVLTLTAEPTTALEEARRLERQNARRQAQILRALLSAKEEAKGAVPTTGIAISAGMHSAVQALADKGLVEYVEVSAHRNPFALLGGEVDGPPPLTDAQRNAAEEIRRRMASRKSSVVLLHGVTGSGKTEVYLDAVANALSLGRTALVMLPEIGLTAQVLDQFKARFDDNQVAVLHSALSPGERYDEWQRIKSGAARIVLGARSSVFAPLKDIGLIVIDEEHDGSYKQDNAPRYNARDIALRRAATADAVVVLGSATPSVESYYKAQRGDYALIELAERIDSRPLPRVEIVDLRAEFGKRPKRGAGTDPPKQPEPEAPEPVRPGVLGQRLQSAIADRLARREQMILFLNRRGFATFVLCRDCGHTPSCPNCSVTLTYHHAARLLRCHHCDHERRAPDVCAVCGGPRVRPFGIGTEKVEESVQTSFENARLVRMDRDTMTRKGAHAEALRAFRRGEADILIGTQIVTKGLDFPNVTLVGVISADIALNIPDFRAGERAFQLLTQVAGRAGRGSRPGEVVVQTFNPDHPTIQRASKHDYIGFYNEEIEHRGELGYPPYSAMANLVVSDPEEHVAQSRMEFVSSAIEQSIARVGRQVRLVGPAPCPLSRLKNRFRWHLMLRGPDRTNVKAVISDALKSIPPSDRNRLSIDIDPLTML